MLGVVFGGTVNPTARLAGLNHQAPGRTTFC
jgi:class 3 adenylate cyclase